MNTLETTTNTATVDLSAFGFGPAKSVGPTSSFSTILGNEENISTPELFNQIKADSTDSTQVPVATTIPDSGESTVNLFNTQDENEGEQGTENDSTSSAGRRKLEKDALVSYLAERVNKQEFSVFADYDESIPLEQYLAKQSEKKLYELLDENINIKTQSVEQRLTQEYIEQQILGTLPPEFVQAYEYAKQGGNDWQSFYSAMGAAQQATALDPSNPQHQVQIARQYLSAIGFGTPEMIENEIAEYQETNKLGQKVSQFKPQLDRMYQEQVAEYNRQQAEVVRQQELAARQYIETVANTIKEGELFGVKLDKKRQAEIYRNLTTADQQSYFGGSTTALGAKIEKLLYVEPDPKKMAMLDWLLTDEKSFFEAFEQRGKNVQVAEDFKKLKTVSATNTAGTTTVETQQPQGFKKQPVNKLPKTFSDLFK
jgi:hypothetical protein